MSQSDRAASARLQPYLGDAFRRSWPNDGARLTYRREAIAALGPAYAAPSRFWIGVGAWAAGVFGGSTLGLGIAALIAGSLGAVVGVVLLLVGLALGVLGVALGVRVIGSGSQLSRALQGWLAVGREDRHPTLGQLLGGIGVARVVLGLLQLLAAVGSTIQGLTALGGVGGPGSALPLLVGSLASWVAGVTVAAGLVRLVRGRGGAMPPAGVSPTADASRASTSPYGGGWVGGESPSPDDVARWPTGAPIARVSGADGARPAEAGSAPPTAEGIVTAVPGFAPPAAGAVPPGVATPDPVPPVPSAAATASAAPPDESTVLRPEIEATRLSTPAPAPVAVRVTLSDGTVLEPGRTLVGRSPEAREGEDVDAFAAVADRSVSKTHLLVEIGDGVVTVTDRASTNGTTLERAGGSRRCAPWVPEVVGVGAVVRFGGLVLEVAEIPGPSA